MQRNSTKTDLICIMFVSTWQKKTLQEGQAQAVIDTPKPFLEAETVEESNAPVRAYHRYIIQQRLKRPGAWWKSDNAGDMLTLRVMRGN